MKACKFSLGKADDEIANSFEKYTGVSVSLINVGSLCL